MQRDAAASTRGGRLLLLSEPARAAGCEISPLTKQKKDRTEQSTSTSTSDQKTAVSESVRHTQAWSDSPSQQADVKKHRCRTLACTRKLAESTRIVFAVMGSRLSGRSADICCSGVDCDFFSERGSTRTSLLARKNIFSRARVVHRRACTW